jgi:hypothetical protein
VVFEAELFGGALGMRRTFILHAKGSQLPSDLLGLTSVRYDPATSPAEVRAINQKLRKAIETEGRRGTVEGLWWQLSLTMRSQEEPSAVGLLRCSPPPALVCRGEPRAKTPWSTCGGGSQLLGHPQANRLTKSSAVWATSRQPWSIVREWPRFGIFTISVTAGLRLWRL